MALSHIQHLVRKLSLSARTGQGDFPDRIRDSRRRSGGGRAEVTLGEPHDSRPRTHAVRAVAVAVGRES